MTEIYSLKGKKGLVVGIANDQSIAYGCAKQFRALGADLAVTYLNEKAEKHVRPLAEELGAEIFLPCGRPRRGGIGKCFENITQRWGRLDFLLHSIAFAPKDDLQGRSSIPPRPAFPWPWTCPAIPSSALGKLAEPLMPDGGTLLTVSFYGGRKVVEHYNLMGPVKAALEISVKYMALRPWQPGHPRACHFARPLAHPRRLGHRPFR